MHSPLVVSYVILEGNSDARGTFSQNAPCLRGAFRDKCYNRMRSTNRELDSPCRSVNDNFIHMNTSFFLFYFVGCVTAIYSNETT